MHAIACLLAVLALFVLNKNGYCAGNGNEKPLPVVLWHGMGDSCCNPLSMGSIKRTLQRELNNTYVLSLKIGGNILRDYESGYLMHPNKQVKYVCDLLAKDEKLRGGYNAIGFSQGGQFLRAVATRCPQPRMNVLISVGGQHQGVFGVPSCPSLSHTSCEYIRRALSVAAYEDWAQKALVQATYWHDPLHEEDYRSKSTFLADINNAADHNERYAENLNKLSKFVMVKFLNDTMVQPKESSWFEFYAPGQDKEILPLRESEEYRGVGLENMDWHGKLLFLAVEGDHLEMPKGWFEENLIPLLR